MRMAIDEIAGRTEAFISLPFVRRKAFLGGCSRNATQIGRA
jgi:hypothetical protein